MQSHGGVAPAADAARLAAGAILSGPAGGVAGRPALRALLGERNLITFDMGGTSTDIASLEDGEPQLTGDKRVGIAARRAAEPRYPYAGCRRRLDRPGRVGGILHVGPGERRSRSRSGLLR